MPQHFNRAACGDTRNEAGYVYENVQHDHDSADPKKDSVRLAKDEDSLPIEEDRCLEYYHG